MSAVVGAVVGAVVAALVASGLVLATTDDDDDPNRATAVDSTSPAGSGQGMGVGESLDIQQLLEIAQPSVVSINIHQGGQPVGAGSGFVFDSVEGLILTNAHVIDGAEQISVTFFDGSAQGAELIGSFPDDDLAMVKVQNVTDLRAATLGSSADLRVGDDVVAIGNALGLGGKPTVTTGIVSAKDRTIPGEGFTLTGLIQTDAAINPGNSGGPLLNAQGEVVGINTAKIIDASNIGFALAIDNLLPLIEDLRNGDGAVSPDQPFLGVSTVALADAELPPEVLDQFGITSADGLLVQTVTPGSAAEEAGMEPGDVLLRADDSELFSNQDLSDIIRTKQPGDTVRISYQRNGDVGEVDAVLKRRGG